MKKFKKTLTILLAVSILILSNVPAVSAEAAFTDVKTTDWYYTYVNRLVETQITSGIGDNRFGPNNTLTRAEFVTFLDKATGHGQEENGFIFPDTETHWAKGWISAAVTANIIDKMTGFNPDKAITRQEAAEMLCRALNLKEDAAMVTPYADLKDWPGYSNTAYKEYLMLGSIYDNKRYFYPSSTLKRSEAAAVIVNLLDYKADPASYKARKKVDVDKQNQEMYSDAHRYAEWQKSVQGIPAELLSNTKGLYKPSIYESYKYLRDETDYFKTYCKFYNMTQADFEKELVRVGSTYANAYNNANYKKIDIFENTLKSVSDPGFILNYMQDKINIIKNRTVVSKGEFLTSTGLIYYAANKELKLRGTAKYIYSSPTSQEALNSEIVGATKKPSKLGVWYEQDFDITFAFRNAGVKVTGMRSVSDIRISVN
ncbi:MAG TPA: S-layer homology domain-containing protein [Ruminiclostridium sp.]|nr:S-layer homology domain-containing protein [Ruminiclostridium sp.]